MGDGSVYECARCGAPGGQYGHWKGSFDGTLDEWDCDPDVYRAYQEWLAARARQLLREVGSGRK
jgi:hypothetical protein